MARQGWQKALENCTQRRPLPQLRAECDGAQPRAGPLALPPIAHSSRPAGHQSTSGHPLPHVHPVLWSLRTAMVSMPTRGKIPHRAA